MTYKKVVVKNAPLSSKPQNTPESRYWSKFSEKKVDRHPGRVSAITFCQKAPHDMAVCTGTRVEIYNTSSMEIKKTAARFKSVVNTADFRDDGAMMAVGTDDGLVQLLDMNSRSILRSFTTHKASVHVAKFIGDGTRLVTASDDKTIQLVDVPTESTLHTWTSHTDLVRCGIQSVLSPDVIVTGSYDHTVKFFDVRSAGANGASSADHILNINHGAPVTDILMFPSGGLLASAGDNMIKIWDIVAGGKLIHTIQAHQKTVSSLALDASGTRLVSAGLDGFMKFYETSTYNVAHSIKFAGPLLSCAFSPDANILATGLVDGTLNMRKRPQLNRAGYTPSRTKDSVAMAKFFGGANSRPQESDFAIEKEYKQHIQTYDRFLKAFQYGSALDAVLASRNPLAIVSVIEELINRNGLEQALSNRDDATIEPFLSFIIKYITNPRYSQLLCDVANLTLELYTPVLGQSVLVDELFSRLNMKLTDEIKLQTDCMQFQGELDLILASAMMTYDEEEYNDFDDEDNMVDA